MGVYPQFLMGARHTGRPELADTGLLSLPPPLQAPLLCDRSMGPWMRGHPEFRMGSQQLFRHLYLCCVAYSLTRVPFAYWLLSPPTSPPQISLTHSCPLALFCEPLRWSATASCLKLSIGTWSQEFTQPSFPKIDQ